MNEKVKQDLSQIMQDLIGHIRSNKAKDYKKRNAFELKRLNRENKKYIIHDLIILKTWNKELKPYIKHLHKYTPDITSQTVVCAVYLLLQYNLKIWKSYFLLIQNGHYSASMTLLRMIKEVTKLIEHFVLEFKSGKDTDLNKWYTGEIIQHSEGRKSSSKFYDEFLKTINIPDFDTEKLQAYIYQMESLEAHPSYVGILECVNPITKDVDFTKQTDLFRTKSSAIYARGTMESVNSALKLIYLFLCPDNERYGKLDKISQEYYPTRGNQLDPNILNSFKRI